MSGQDHGADRRYPDRPMVGVGAVILAAPDDRLSVGMPASRAPWGVVLVKRRFEPLAGHWSLPGGMLEVGETLAAGVGREMLEETGLVVAVGGIVEVFDRISLDDHGRARHHYVLIDYLCRPVGGTLQAGSDVSDVLVVEPGEVERYAVSPSVPQAVRKALELVTR